MIRLSVARGAALPRSDVTALPRPSWSSRHGGRLLHGDIKLRRPLERQGRLADVGDDPGLVSARLLEPLDPGPGAGPDRVARRGPRARDPMAYIRPLRAASRRCHARPCPNPRRTSSPEGPGTGGRPFRATEEVEVEGLRERIRVEDIEVAVHHERRHGAQRIDDPRDARANLAPEQLAGAAGARRWHGRDRRGAPARPRRAAARH